MTANAASSNKSIRPVSIVATGSYLPDRVLTNAELEQIVDTTDEWIYTRTGMRERRIARADEAASHMASAAARRAMEAGRIKPEEIGMIVVGTCTPDMVFPNTGCFVQDQIGAKGAFCLDLSAACSGFLYALEVGRQFVANGTVDTALVIGSEKMSCILDWQDRSTCVLFGDGAGAAILQHRNGSRGILSSVLASDGSLSELLNVPGGGSRHPPSEETVKNRMHYLKMAGKEVFKHAVTHMARASMDALDRAGVSVDDIACIIPHQANARIIQAISQRIHAPMDKFFLNVDRYGNTSAASVIIALDEAVRAGRVKRGDLVLMVVFGGGFTWAATVVEW